MKRIRVNLDKISEFDLQLAKNPRVLALLDEIIPLSLEQRAYELKALQQKLERGEANLFEEHVKSHLLEHRSAEWIRVINKNLPVIEQELQKRQPSQSPSPAQAQAESLPAAQPVPTQDVPHKQPPAPQTHSELLDFLATQKPPKPPVSSSGRSKQVQLEEKPSLFSVKEIAFAVVLLLVLVASIGFVTLSRDNDSSEEFLTFQEQAQQNSPEARQARKLEQETQVEFDAAAQELRFGDFESGKTRLFELAGSYPLSVHAENAYILIADTARLRKQNPDLALQTYQRFLEKWPKSPKAGLVQLKIGFAYEDLEDFSSAEAAYRLLIADAGENSRLGQLARERLLRLKE